VDYLGPDVCSLRLQLTDTVLWIHNFYNQPPGSHYITNYPSSLAILPDLLGRQGEYLVLGDFNLHYPFWSGPRNPASHLAANPMVKTLLERDLVLATPRGMITWEARGLSSTIDLAFISQWLLPRLVECNVNKALDHGSDHFPISIQFNLLLPRLPPRPARAWKKADFDLVATTTAQELTLPGTLATPDQVETYSNYLVLFIQELVNLAVLWANPSVYSVP